MPMFAFAKGRNAASQATEKNSSQWEQRIPHFTGGAQDGRSLCKSPEHRGPHASSTMDSAFPVVHCPGQDLGAAGKATCIGPGQVMPRGTALLGPAEGLPVRGLASSGLFRP